MTRHEFFKKRLQEIGMYDSDSDYGGMIGTAVEELSKCFEDQRHSGGSAVSTIELFVFLMKEWEKPETHADNHSN